jgi:hypothetical protein
VGLNLNYYDCLLSTSPTTPMVQEPFFSILADVTPIVQGNVVATPVVGSPVTMVATSVIGSPMAEIDEDEVHIF